MSQKIFASFFSYSSIFEEDISREQQIDPCNSLKLGMMKSKENIHFSPVNTPPNRVWLSCSRTRILLGASEIENSHFAVKILICFI
jgi:hypothetical protein